MRWRRMRSTWSCCARRSSSAIARWPWQSRSAPAVRIPLAEVAHDAGFLVRRIVVERVESAVRRVRIEAGETLSYDALLIAVGARPVTAVPGALTFRGREDVDTFRRALSGLQTGGRHRIAFIAPTVVSWTLPLYELALMTAAWTRERDASTRCGGRPTRSPDLASPSTSLAATTPPSASGPTTARSARTRAERPRHAARSISSAERRPPCAMRPWRAHSQGHQRARCRAV